MPEVQFTKTYGRLISDFWSNPAIKQKLKSDPKETLHSYGIEIPAGQKIKLLEADAHHEYFVVPDQSQVNSFIAKAQEAEYQPAIKYGKLMNALYADNDLMRRFRTDPRTILHQHGIDVPGNKQIKIEKLGPDELALVLPLKPQQPQAERLSAGETALVAWGTAAGTGCLIVAAVL